MREKERVIIAEIQHIEAGTIKIKELLPLIMKFRVLEDLPDLFYWTGKFSTRILLNWVSIISGKNMLYFLLFMKPCSFLSYQLHSLSFPKYTNCFQSTDFFITAYCMLVTASFLYWTLDWTSISNLTWTVIAHIKQIKPANHFLEDILYIYYHWRVPQVYLLRRNGEGENIIMVESEDIHFPKMCNWPCILFFLFSSELFYNRKTYWQNFSVSVLQSSVYFSFWKIANHLAKMRRQ